MPLPLPEFDALLPAQALKLVEMHVGWTLAIAATWVFLLRAFPAWLRVAGVVLIIAANFLPAEQTPSWWLGLAFQIPSFTFQGLCALYLYRTWRQRHASTMARLSAHARWPNGLLILAAILGWVLLLDLFAMFNVSLYAIGFSGNSVLACLLLAAILQLWSQRSDHAKGSQTLRDCAAVIVGAMALHLFFRLPTGNAWDALIDPWLWLGAQTLLLVRAVTWIFLLVKARAKVIAARTDTASY